MPDSIDSKAPDGKARGNEATSSRNAGVTAEAGFDQVLDRLRQVVERLETGSLGLEQSLQAFEEGVRLSRRGAEMLDKAERRVEMLARGDGGADKVVPLPEAAGQAGDDGT